MSLRADISFAAEMAAFWTHTNTHPYIQIHIHTFIHAHTHTHTYLSMLASCEFKTSSMNLRADISFAAEKTAIWTHTHTYTYIHTHTHT